MPPNQLVQRCIVPPCSPGLQLFRPQHAEEVCERLLSTNNSEAFPDKSSARGRGRPWTVGATEEQFLLPAIPECQNNRTTALPECVLTSGAFQPFEPSFNTSQEHGVICPNPPALQRAGMIKPQQSN